MSSSAIASAPARGVDLGEVRMRVTALLVATMWLDVLHGATSVASPRAAWLLALAGLAAQLAFTAFEALAAAAAWRLVGKVARWSALAPRLLVASSFETLAMSVASGRAHVAPGWALVLAGPRAARASGAEHGLATAFAAVGLLTLWRWRSRRARHSCSRCGSSRGSRRGGRSISSRAGASSGERAARAVRSG